MWSQSTKPDAQRQKQVCSRCRASRQIPCEFCGGKGEVVIGRDGRGGLKFGRCTSCFGRKMTRCRTCNGDGFV